MDHRIGVVADIHANAWALEAVLADARRQGITLLFNLGDILYGALRPRVTYDLLRSEDVLLTIRGNQDREIYEAGAAERASNPTLDYVVRDLGAEPVAWLKNLPATAVFEDEILLCHGTPSSDETYFLEDVATGHPVVKPEAEIVRLLGDVRHPVILCGHTHIPRLVRLASGQMVVNPGSVGLAAYSDSAPVPHAMENHSPSASYAILAKSTAGWDVAFRKVAYDWETAARAAAELGRSDWARQIATGRV
jgi:predicted phosphodiesterase